VRRKNGLLDEKREEAREKEKNTKAMGREAILYLRALGPSAFAFENEMRKHGPSLGHSCTCSADEDGDGEGTRREERRKVHAVGILRKGAEEF
jgi:hypothetical protein